MAPVRDDRTAVKSTNLSHLVTFVMLYIQLTNLAVQMRSYKSLYRHYSKKCRRLRMELQRNRAQLSELVVVSPFNVKQRLWIRPKTSGWWDSVVPKMPHCVWKENFRISKQTFATLCGRLREKFERQDTKLRKCIPLVKRVAMCVYVLSSSTDLRTVAHLFGVGKSTLREAVHEFCINTVDDIMPDLIVFPASAESLQVLIDGFFHDWEFPQTFGALDGFHIQVSPPKDFAIDYYCLKQFYSTVLLAMCDHAYRFLYVNVGTPGCNNNDAHVFNQSILPRIITDNPIFSKSAKQIQGLNVEPLILADSAFPLMPNLLKPYQAGPHLTPHQQLFNDHLLAAHNVIKIAFGRLKARFLILTKRLDYDINNVTRIIQTCCTLHNLCEIMGDVCETNWISEDPEPEDSICTLGDTDSFAQNIRNKLSLYFQLQT